jgi:hypothetical protein
MNEWIALQTAKCLNEVWSKDFVRENLTTSRRIKRLTAADEFSH